MLSTLRQDFAFAVRSLLRGRMMTATAVISLAAAITANTTVFSLVQALEFPRLIYPDPSRIVFLETRNDVRGIDELMVSSPDAEDVAASSRTLQNVTVSASQSSVLHTQDTAARVQGRRVEPGFFRLLGIAPAYGRVLADRDVNVIVLSDSLWRGQLAGDPRIIGRPLHLDGGTVTVVGIMPPLFDGDADFWTPLGNALSGFKRDDRQFDVMARIAPGQTTEDVNRELTALSRRLAVEHPGTNGNWVIYATPLARLHGRDAEQTFLLLQAAVVLLLLIACANIANLLLARGVERRRELAVRVALGASRGRLIGLLLSESLVLATSGGALGVLLSIWSIRAARSAANFPDVIEPHLNLPVMAFTLVVVGLTGILCGCVPAVRGSGIAPDPVLRETGRGTTDKSINRLGASLVIAQIAIALTLATGATLLLRSFVNRERVPLGFEPRGAFRADVSLISARYADPASVTQAVDSIIAQASADPAVVAVGARTWALPTGAGAQRQLTLPSRGDSALPAGIRRNVEAVTPGYFTAIGARLKRGRAFTAADRNGSQAVAIVNEELAERMWPAGGEIGDSLRLGAAADAAPVVTVIGVVSSIRRSPMHDVPLATVYVPFAQYPNGSVTLVTRARGAGGPAVRALTAAIQKADPELLAENVRTMEQDVADFMAPLRFVGTVLTGFAVAAVLLCGLGVFGVMSYMVAQRSHEIAVRSALGANRPLILRLVLARAIRLAATGIVFGVPMAAVASRALNAYLFGVTATDLATYLLVAAALSLLAIAACWRPARRAASIDPIALLRN